VSIKSVICGTGYYVPPKVVPNSYFETYLETNDQWIRERTGIVERRYAEEGVTASELAEPACRMALEKSGIKADEIDGIICATVTPDHVFPSTACIIGSKLGIKGALAFDVNAVCSGFLYALSVADGLIKSGVAKTILVIGSEVYSRILDFNDRGTCILFGDGAACVILRGEENSNRGILSTSLGADGHYSEILKVEKGVSVKEPSIASPYLYMNGKEVFKLAVRKLSEINRSIVEDNEFSLSEITWFVTHQANKRILLSVASDLEVSEEHFPMNIEKYGNTSAASVPLLLAEMDQAGQLKPGDLIVLSAFGGGVTWGSALIRW